MHDSVTKPQKEENVILFLNKREKGYVSVNMEHSIFTVSEDGILYSFSNTEELSSYDGKKETILFEKIKEVLG